MATAAHHIAPTFAELARAKRHSQVMAIIGMMSPREAADLAYTLLTETLDISDAMADATAPVVAAFEAQSALIDDAVEADELDRMHPEDRRVWS